MTKLKKSSKISWRYLGVTESNEIQHGTMREKIRNECY